MKKFTLLLLFAFLSFATKAQVETTNIPDTTLISPKIADSTNLYAIDINSDTRIDFRIGIKYYQSYESAHQTFDNYNIFIIGDGNNSVNAGPFLSNDTINQQTFFTKSNMIYTRDINWGRTGPWPQKLKTDNQWAYIGIKMMINENIHYGWIRLKTDGYSFTIDRYAYNKIPNQQLRAGQTN